MEGKIDGKGRKEGWKKGRSRELQTSQPHFSPWEQVFAKAVSRHTNDKKLTVKSQHEFTER